jgi:hypothetical protein
MDTFLNQQAAYRTTHRFAVILVCHRLDPSPLFPNEQCEGDLITGKKFTL